MLHRRQRLFKNWKLQRNLVFQFNGISSICTKSYSNRSVFPLSPFSSFNYKLCGIPWLSATSGKRRYKTSIPPHGRFFCFNPSSPPPSWASMDIFWNHKYRIINSIFLVEYYLIWITNKDNITGIKLALCGNYFYKFVFWKVLSGKLQPSCSSWWL